MTFPSSSCNVIDLFTDQSDISETQFLKSSIVNHTKYGSTNHNLGPAANYRYMTHYVDPNDTLQGIALKYGCKIESIKKFNKIFSDDNNYLRSRLSLLIPIEIGVGTSSTLDSSSTQTSSSSLDAKKSTQSTLISKNTSNISNHQSLSFDNFRPNEIKSSCKSTSLCEPYNSDKTPAEESLADFLIRIDSSIAKTRNQVEKMAKKNEQTIENYINQELPRFNSTKFTRSERNILTSSTSSPLPFASDGNTLRVSVNSKRKIKSSLKRLEKSHEEIFEL